MKFYLIGLPGSGKTTIGKKIALHFSLNFVDLDHDIETAEQSSISDIFKNKGEDYFRLCERKALHKTEKLSNAIISSGGGTPCFFDNMDWMNKHGITIFINTDIQQIKLNLSKDIQRPLLAAKTIEQLLNERLKYYNKSKYKFENEDAVFEIVKNHIN